MDGFPGPPPYYFDFDLSRLFFRIVSLVDFGTESETLFRLRHSSSRGKGVGAHSRCVRLADVDLGSLKLAPAEYGTQLWRRYAALGNCHCARLSKSVR